MDAEVALMLRLRVRDEAALAELYGRLGGHVYALALRLLDSREEAEEVLQDTFVRAFERAHQYRPELGSPRAFVYTIARHEALSRLRARGARPQRTEARDDELEPNLACEPPDLTTRTMVRGALEHLAERDRALLEATFFQGLSHSEIAASSGLPLGTVKTRVRRALLQLRRFLEGA